MAFHAEEKEREEKPIASPCRPDLSEYKAELLGLKLQLSLSGQTNQVELLILRTGTVQDEK